MTNEKTNPLPYRVAAETGLPDMSEPVITPDDVARGTQLLRRYKDGKRALEARIIADEQWYRMRHWQYLRDRRREQGADVVEPTSAWLFNAIVSKHADAMDSFPEAVILPRSEQDERTRRRCRPSCRRCWKRRTSSRCGRTRGGTSSSTGAAPTACSGSARKRRSRRRGVRQLRPAEPVLGAGHHRPFRPAATSSCARSWITTTSRPHGRRHVPAAAAWSWRSISTTTRWTRRTRASSSTGTTKSRFPAAARRCTL